MIRISLPFIFDICESIEPLSRLPDGPVRYGEVFLPLVVAQGALQTLSTSLYAPYLRTSYALLHSLLNAINAQTSQAGPNSMDRQLNPYDLYTIKNAYGQYRTALLAELGTFNAYFVTQKGGFDMYSLLTVGESIWPTDLGTKVPEALIDAREASKALAYEVPTACGFHAFRVMETVLRRYYTHATGGAARPKVRNIGVYINAMRRLQKGDEKILGAVKQMADLHRNPLIHPEVVLTLPEAIATVGMAVSAITAMLAVLPVQPQTTTTALATGGNP